VRRQEAEAVIDGEVWEVYSLGSGYYCEEEGCFIRSDGPDLEINWRPAAWELRCHADEESTATKILCHAHMEAFTGLGGLTPEPAR
jgi:hypothetical protein